MAVAGRREKGAGAESADRKHAGDDGNVGDDRPRSRADRHLPWFGNRRRGLQVSRPEEPCELPGTGPAGRGVPQDRIGESERDICPEVPEFVKEHRDGEGDRAASHRGPPPAV